MKKLVFISVGLFFLLMGCAPKQDTFSAYTGKSSETIFESGEKNLAKHHYEEAIHDFEALDAIYPFSAHAQQAQLDIIYAYYRNGQNEMAIAAADRYIHLYPRGPNTDYAYFMKGLIEMNQGRSWLQKLIGLDPASYDVAHAQSAFVAFSELVQRFPDSPYVHAATVYLRYIRNVLARNELQVSWYYRQRKAYNASLNRASGIVQHFEGSPLVIPALALMVEDYRSLNLPGPATDSLRVLQVNFPNSVVLPYLLKSQPIPYGVLVESASLK